MLKIAVNKILGKYADPESGQEFTMVEMDVDKYHNKGVKYLNAKKYKKAVTLFKKEIECEPTGSLGYQFLGQTFQAMGNIKEARNNYEIALSKAEEMYRRYPEYMDKEIIDDIKKDLASARSRENSNSV